MGVELLLMVFELAFDMFEGLNRFEEFILAAIVSCVTSLLTEAAALDLL